MVVCVILKPAAQISSMMMPDPIICGNIKRRIVLSFFYKGSRTRVSQTFELDPRRVRKLGNRRILVQQEKKKAEKTKKWLPGSGLIRRRVMQSVVAVSRHRSSVNVVMTNKWLFALNQVFIALRQLSWLISFFDFATPESGLVVGFAQKRKS